MEIFSDYRKTIEQILLSDNVENELKTKKEILFRIIPELKDEDGFDQKSKWHIYDVWNHTIAAVKNSRPELDIRLALLLHDIGKPHSFQEDGDIRHFRGHPEKSAEIARNVLERLGYESREMEKICYLIANHATIINPQDVNHKNIEIIKKLLHIEFCDASAYNPEYSKSVFDRLNAIKKELQEIEKKIKNRPNNEDERE